MTATAAPQTCGTCGTELNPGALFCVSCGTAVPREQRVAVLAGRPRAWFERDDEEGAPVLVVPEPVATEPVVPEPVVPVEVDEDKPESLPEPEPEAEPEPEPSATELTDAELSETTADIPVVGRLRAARADVHHPPYVPRAAGRLYDITVPPPAPGERLLDAFPMLQDSAAGSDAPVAGTPVDLLADRRGPDRAEPDRRAPGGPPEEPRRTAPRGAVLASIMVFAVLLVAVVSWMLVRPTAPNVAEEAVAAWRAGNAAWAKGQIDVVCDRYDGIGSEGLWRDRATCVASESEGYGQSTVQQRASLEAMTVDPRSAQVIGDDLVVIMFRDARVGGAPSPYFTDTDFAVMRRIAGQGWRQVGVRYGSDVVGTVPPAVLDVAPPEPSATTR